MFAPLEIVLMTWHDFVGHTNVNGISNIGTAKSICRKLIWAAIAICGIVLTLIGLAAVISGYLAYGVNSSSVLKHYSKVKFPSVTVCNQNRVDCATASEVIYACNSSAKGAVAPINTTGMECKLSEQSLASVLDIMDLVCQSHSHGKNAAARKKRATKRQKQPPTGSELGARNTNADQVYRFMRSYMDLNESERMLIGHQFTNLIQECIFRERDCTDPKNFEFINTPGFGNCFIFNYAANSNDAFGGLRVSSMTGPDFGLTLVLNIEQNSYQTKGTLKAGARITIHNPDTIPLPKENGRDLRPNTAANIAMQQVAMKRQKAPFVTNCSSSWEETNYTQFVVDDWPYSLSLCQRLCLLSSFELECGCFHPLYLDSDKNRNGYEPCNLKDVEEPNYVCVYNIMEQLDSGLRNCSCHVDCNEVDYALFQSEALWPSAEYETLASNAYGTDSRKRKVSISDNVLQVSTYFNSLNMHVVEETPVYESVSDGNFIAALGGALGLYLGISIVAFFEVIEFFIDLGVNSFLYCAKGKRMQRKSSNPEEP